jgi:small subunit ribosomal protein S21
VPAPRFGVPGNRNSEQAGFIRPARGAARNHSEPDGGELQVAEVIIQESESLENALRRFKRKVQQEDIIKEIKKHSFYMKPGEKRRTKEALSRKRLRKKMRRETE